MKVLVTGGGTGGHVNPALAIANTIREHIPDAEIAFVGTSHGIENVLVPKAGYPLYHIEVQGLRRSLSLGNIKTAWLLLTAMRKARQLVRTFQPDLVVGTGGYVCYPIIRAAALAGVPTALHESNAVPGVAVKMLEKYVNIVFTNFEETASHLKHPEKAVHVGNPMRSEFQSIDYEEARRKLGISGKYRYFILSCGGSMGAERVNDEALEVMKRYSSQHSDVYHVHATGSLEFQAAHAKFEELGLNAFDNVELLEYIYDMPWKMAAADLVINRAGAMTISELALMKKACILIPSPNVTNNHQYKNAHALEKAGAAVLLQEKDLNEGKLAAEVENLLQNRSLRRQMSESIAAFAVPDANEQIFRRLMQLVHSESKKS